MSNKNAELNTVKENLAQLINELQECTRQYEKDVSHSANYHGCDEGIEQQRDEIAFAAFQRVKNVKQKAIDQANLLNKLLVDY